VGGRVGGTSGVAPRVEIVEANLPTSDANATVAPQAGHIVAVAGSLMVDPQEGQV
jgi:hypothetical protein